MTKRLEKVGNFNDYVWKRIFLLAILDFEQIVGDT